MLVMVVYTAEQVAWRGSESWINLSRRWNLYSSLSFTFTVMDFLLLVSYFLISCSISESFIQLSGRWSGILLKFVSSCSSSCIRWWFSPNFVLAQFISCIHLFCLLIFSATVIINSSGCCYCCCPSSSSPRNHESVVSFSWNSGPPAK